MIAHKVEKNDRAGKVQNLKLKGAFNDGLNRGIPWRFKRKPVCKNYISTGCILRMAY
jgi:hypothetical protein